MASQDEIETAVYKTLGKLDSAVLQTAMRCVRKGYDKSKTIRRLMDKDINSHEAEKIAGRIMDGRSADSNGSATKRRDGNEDSTGPRRKKSKFSEEKVDDSAVAGLTASVQANYMTQPSFGSMNTQRVSDIMNRAKATIEFNKAQLAQHVGPIRQMPTSTGLSAISKTQQAAALNSSIQERLKMLGMAGGLPAADQKSLHAHLQQRQNQRANVIMDAEGRTIDTMTGEVLTLPHHTPTLRANIRAKKQAEFKESMKEHRDAPEDISMEKYFDPRMSSKAAQRPRRGFKFHEPGKFQQLASRLRTKAQLEKLQSEIAHAAKKTGIASAAKLATFQPKKQLVEGQIPEVEWWDAVILKSENQYEKEMTADHLAGITNLIEHPMGLKPPIEKKDIEINVYLTKKERKKLRRQNRAEALKEEQEKIRLGLLPTPEPKVRMANMMRVLGTEAVSDPTKVESHVRQQMAARQKKHEVVNQERKLTDEQRKEKKARKLTEDTSQCVHISIYRIKNLSNPSHKFKIEANAKQLYMTGLVALMRDCNVVCVEGGTKQQNKFKRLMLKRINWRDGKSRDSDDEDEEKRNTCQLVWQGTRRTRSFAGVTFKQCPTETYARDQFNKFGVPEYWDLAWAGTILEEAGDHND